jgi:hypothetical protein
MMFSASSPGRETDVPNYSVIESLTSAIEIPKDGTLSRTIRRDDHVKVVLFGFAGGQELSQCTWKPIFPTPCTQRPT